MRILVTGGAGFIASHITDAYINLGHHIAVVDNLSTGKSEFINKRAKFYHADITNRTEIEEIIELEKPEVINHHAAQISVRNSTVDPQNDARINLLGLLNLLEAGRINGLKKFIFASSGGVVYGEAEVLPTPESYTPLLPLSPYGVTKLASELYLYYYFKSYGISYIALRYSNVYGPRQNPHGEAGVVAIFTKKLLKRETPIINGDGSQTRDYIFVDDIVQANIASLEKNAVGVFNIGTGRETNVNDLFGHLKKILNTKSEAKHGPARPGEQKRSCLDIKLAGKKIGFKACVSLADGFNRTVEYFRSYEKE